MQEGAVKCGWLFKEGHGMPKVWSRRWFVLKDSQLLYFESEKVACSKSALLCRQASPKGLFCWTDAPLAHHHRQDEITPFVFDYQQPIMARITSVPVVLKALIFKGS